MTEFEQQFLHELREQIKLTHHLMAAIDTLNTSVANLTTAANALTPVVASAVAAIGSGTAGTAGTPDAPILAAAASVDTAVSTLSAATAQLQAALPAAAKPAA